MSDGAEPEAEAAKREADHQGRAAVRAETDRSGSSRLRFDSVEHARHRLESLGYVADEALATSLFLATAMGRPLLLEGPPGVGKTELAKAVSECFDTELIRLQCYEGLDLAQAAYEWNHPRQLMEIQAQRAIGGTPDASTGTADVTRGLYTEEFLLRRPLLHAIDPQRTRAPVLLIDELDRADEEFESFLLELLSDFQLTIPELGTLVARHRPVVLLTSNRTREVHDALRRRCLYHWIDYPSLAKECQILQRRVPDLQIRLVEQVARFCQALRARDLYKHPGVAESVDWARALQVLGVESLDRAGVEESLGCLLKYRDDVERVRGDLTAELLEAAVGA